MNIHNWEKISEKYYEEILSPIKNSSKNPLFNDLNRVKNKDKKSIINLGCGLGEIEGILSKNFKEVIGIDFSKKMIRQSKEKNKSLKNVKFYLGDISNLKKFHNKFEVAISINSIISSDLNKIDKMFKEVYNVLKKNGQFICILPAMEVFLYQALIIAKNEAKKNTEIKEIEKKIKKLIKKKEHNFLLGITDFEGKQKNYYRFEILWRLKKAGFKRIKIKKVLYSWKEFSNAGQGYFPKEDPPWDWYAFCEK